MDKMNINGKALYTPKGAAREYAQVGCNFYNGCPHDCGYCYLKRGVLSRTMGKKDVSIKACLRNESNALAVFKRECDKFKEYLKGTGIFFSFSTDPMLRETYMLTLLAARYAMSNGIPVMILTKCADIILSNNAMFMDIAKTYGRMLAIGFTLTGRDDMEPNASPNSDRIKALRRVMEIGCRTFASIEPIISVEDSFSMVDKSVSVCEHFKIGLMSGVKKDYYQKEEISKFILHVEVLTKGLSTVYWKSSVRKYICDDNAFSYPNVVGIDYNMFE